MNSRFNLGLRARNRPSSSLFNRKADGIDGNASAFPDSFILEELLVPAEASHSSLFALSSRNERNFRSFVFNHLPTLFTLCKRATRHLASFQSLPHSLQEYPGVGPPLRQNTFISQPPPATRAFRNEAHQATKPANWNWPLLAAHYVFISSHPYFVPSPGETLSDALSSYGEEIPNPSS